MEGVRTSYEEMDVIIYKAREYYLIECKWMKGPIEASVIREFYGKLSHRAGVDGIVVSMSGFTAGAVGEVKKQLHSKVILLFGPKDVEALVYENAGFEDLLNQKHQAVMTQENVLFE